jgi:small-conductance mechanosensitive channel
MNPKDLSSEELDQLIETLAAERRQRSDLIKDLERGTQLQATLNPIWKAEVIAANKHLAISVQERGRGWCNFAFNRQTLADLTSYFTRILLGGHLEALPSENAPQQGQAPIPAEGSNRIN